MQRLILLLAVLGLVVPGVVFAKLYKCENEAGEVVYTDKPCKGGKGEELKLAPFSTYSPNIVPVPPSANRAEKDPAASYTVFEIISPKYNKLIRSNTGTVMVTFKLEGPLLSLKGHKFAIELDGKKLKSRGVTNQIRLSNVNPGTHTLKVFIVDADDKIIKKTGLVNFHLLAKTKLNSPTPGSTGSLSEKDSSSDAQDPLSDIPNNTSDSEKPRDIIKNSDITKDLPGGINKIPGGSGTIPGGSRNIPGGRR